MKAITRFRSLFSSKQKESSEDSSSGLYGDIFTLPAWNYERIYSTGKLDYLIKGSESNIGHMDLFSRWIDIQQQMIDEFGQDENQRDYFEAVKEALPFILKAVVCHAKGDDQGRRRNEFEFEIRVARAKSMLPQGKSNPGSWKKAVDKMIGFTVDLKSVSAYDYENYKRQLVNG